MRRFGVLACFAALGTLGSSCTQSGASIYIVKAAKQDDTCMIDQTDAFTSGSWDVSADIPYTMFFVVNNLLRQRPGPVAADPNGVVIDEVEVTLLDGSGASLGTYTVPASGFIPSSTDGVTPGTSVVSAAVIPVGAAGVVGPAGSQVTVLATLHGQTLGAVDVTSREFPFQVTIYRGQFAYSQLQCYPLSGSPTVMPSNCNPGNNSQYYCPPCDPMAMISGVKCP